MLREGGARIRRRVFVVGVPRSGTTLVQSLLAAHSELTSFTESHFFSRHFTLLPLVSWPILVRNPVPRLREFLSENDEPPPGAASWFEARGGTATKGRGALRSRALQPFLTRAAARKFLRVLDELTLRRGKSGWLEKTPRHLSYIPFLERVSTPDSGLRFVHVIRDGLEVVSSLHRASRGWEHAYDLETCVRRWNTDLRFSLGRAGAPADRFVFYEQLTADPEKTLRQLLAGLGLGWEPAILERYAHASERLITRQESWKGDVGRGIRHSRTSDRALTAEQRDRVNRSLHHDLYRRLLERAETG